MWFSKYFLPGKGLFKQIFFCTFARNFAAKVCPDVQNATSQIVKYKIKIQ